MSSNKISIPNRTSVEVELYGQTFNVKKPSVTKIEELQNSLSSYADDKSGKETLRAMKNWLTDLGIGKDILKEIELEHLFLLIEILSGSKKN